MWERCRDLVEAQGRKVLMGTRRGDPHEDGKAVSVVAEAADGAPSTRATT